MKGLVELAKEILRLPVVVGMPAKGDLIADTSVNDPSFVPVLGNIILANKYRGSRTSISFNWKSLVSSIVKVLKKLLP